MNAAGEQLKISLMYDSPLASEIILSTQMRAATQGSAMQDYQPGNSQWKNPFSALLFWSVGLMPWKDAFWTTSRQDGCPYHSCYEPNPELQTLFALLSTGPVTPGDAVGHINKNLIMQTCRSDGVLLKAGDRPLLYLNSVYAQGFNSLDLPVVLSTSITIDSMTYYYILAANLSDPYKITLAEFELENAVIFEYHDIQNTLLPFKDSFIIPKMKIPPYNPDESCGTPPCNQTIDFRYYVIAPTVTSGWTCLGELDKFVTVSPNRIANFIYQQSGIEIVLSGVPGEMVTIYFLAPQNSIVSATCSIGVFSATSIKCQDGSCRCL